MNPSARKEKCKICNVFIDDEEIVCSSCSGKEYDLGYKEGYEEGLKDGKDKGQEEGFSQGFNEASNIALEQIDDAKRIIEKEQRRY